MFKDDLLLGGYNREKSCYMKILDLAEELREALKSGSTMQEVISILRRKNLIMEEIDSIERTIEEEKKNFRLCNWKPAAVSGMIGELSSLVERILVLERENEVLFSSARHSLERQPVDGAGRDYACRRYSRIASGEGL